MHHDEIHQTHDHTHGEGCGHPAVDHAGHRDFLHDGHLHHPTGDAVEEHAIDVDDAHPDDCTPDHRCAGHDEGHQHSPGCGHPAVPHGDHVGYLVEGHLHRPHDGHCDDHGALAA